eukprot:jgi/Mesvir1/13825/Mv15976-RA.1
MVLLRYIKGLAKQRIILASASPRRFELLTNLGLVVEVEKSTFEENLDKSLYRNSPGDYARDTAMQKAIEVTSRILTAHMASAADSPGSVRLPSLIIAADTIVAHNGEILEKPRDEADAYRILRSLSGAKHQVYSGVALVVPQVSALGGSEAPPVVRSFSECTEVQFAELSDDEIHTYIRTGEPMDKAGAYGIQRLGGTFVTGIRGCFPNVAGFPIHRFAVELEKLILEGALVVEAER